MEIRQAWKVGALAEASGLTVRTLHHWDQIGLLSPSSRTGAGHREYSEQDVVRLYQVLALRRLGLGLETIAMCLDVGVDPVLLVADQLADVEASLAALEALRQRLVDIHQGLRVEREPSVSTLFEVLRAMDGPGPHANSDAVRSQLDSDQQRALQDHAAAVGPAAHYLLEVEWPELYRRAEALRVAGVDPAAPAVRKLVKRIDELSALFSGGDSRLSAAVRAAWQDELEVAEPAAKAASAVDATAAPSERDPAAPVGAWHELITYLDRARSEI